MSSQEPGQQTVRNQNLFSRFFAAIVEAANGRPFEREPIREMLLMVAVLSGLVAGIGIGQVIWTASPIHTGLVFAGYICICIIALFGSWVVNQDG